MFSDCDASVMVSALCNVQDSPKGADSNPIFMLIPATGAGVVNDRSCQTSAARKSNLSLLTDGAQRTYSGMS